MNIGLTQYGDRPMMPTYEDEQRARHQFARLSILMHHWDQILEDWIELSVGADRAQIMGIPDTSMNSISDLARQLSTPGLYGHRPKVRNAQEPETAALMVGPGGHYDEAGVWSKMVWVQQLTLGLSDMFARWDVDRRGRFTMRLVAPHNIYLRGNPDNPGEIIELWELRRRWHSTRAQFVFTWDVYSIGWRNAKGDFLEGKEPSFRIWEATPGRGLFDKLGKSVDFGKGGLGVDLSSEFIANPATGAMGALVGDAYPWVGLDKEPELPWGRWQDMDTGMLWNTFLRRGAHRGTLNVAKNWSYAGHCALDATGSTVIAWGLTPHGVDSIKGEGGQNGNRVDGQPPLKSIVLAPGSIVYHEVDGETTPNVEVIGPGANLDVVSRYAADYATHQRIPWGLGGADASRKHANPTSGTALAISNEERREHSKQVTPVFRRHDQEALRRAAIVARVGGLGTFPETGYSWEYFQIPRTADENQAARDDLTWKKEQGLISEIDEYQAIHEGSTRDDAKVALVRVAMDEAELKKARTDALLDAGLIEETPDVPTDIELAPTDLAAVIKADEARASKGLGPIAGGEATISAFRAGTEAAAVAAAPGESEQPTDTSGAGDDAAEE